MKEYLIHALVAVAAVYVVNHYLVKNLTVAKVSGTVSPSNEVLA